MGKTNIREDKLVKRVLLSSIPVIFTISPILHFLFGWSGNLTIVGIFAPVNESIWEHCKLGTVPMLLWWVISYLVLKKKMCLSIQKWIFCTAISLTLIPITISGFYYFYTGAFGIHSLTLDIFSLFLALVVAQFTAIHVYKYVKMNNALFIIGVVAIIIILLSTVIFTFIQYHIPLFLDGPSGKYGIVK